MLIVYTVFGIIMTIINIAIVGFILCEEHKKEVAAYAWMSLIFCIVSLLLVWGYSHG